MIKLSQRLRAVADLVPRSARLADIGSDHAKLPIFLIEKKQIEFAVTGEVASGPYEISKAHTKDYPEIVPRLADGLAAIENSDAIDTIVIAGMGGILISEILEAGKEKLQTIQNLILQANREEAEVRHWLSQNDFQIVSEKIVEDDHKIYEVILAKSGKQELTVEEEKFGRFLKESPIFKKKWQGKLSKIEKVLSLIPEDKKAERDVLEAEKTMIEKVLQS